jgi:hypothetical protein
LSCPARQEFLNKLGSKEVALFKNGRRVNVFVDATGKTYEVVRGPFGGSTSGSNILISADEPDTRVIQSIFHEADHVDNDTPISYNPRDPHSVDEAGLQNGSGCGC